MRFAYIDSQGNEVAIPSEDALRLRIELGAIVEGTSFFDEESGRWAPAGDHEVFRRLKRELAEKDHPGPLSVGALRPDPLGPPPTQPSRPTPPPAPASPPPPAAAAPREPSPAPPEPPVAPADAPDASVDAGLSADDDEGFDFGDFGALDLEEAGPVPARASSPSPDTPAPHYQVDQVPEAVEPEDDPWTVPGRDPWAPELDAPGGPAPDMGSVGFGDEPAPAADVPPGRHPFDSDEEMPDWLKNDPEFGAEAPSGRSFPTREQVRVRYEQDHGGPAPSPSTPRPPRRVSGRASGGPPWGRIVAGVAAAAVVGAGAWYVVTGGGDADGSGAAPVVELPPISPSLEPVFREAAGQAMAATVDSLQGLPSRAAVPDEPHADWLAGSYMARAGEYGDVRLYWEALGRYVQIMRAREGELFRAALGAALDSVVLADDDRAAVVARSEAGFAAAAPDREGVYGQLRAVVDAALSLHLFLEQNQDAIDYEPADAGLSRDPILEAVPATEALGEEMWNQVAEITSALDALGYLDRVTTERLLDVFFGKLAAVEIR